MAANSTPTSPSVPSAALAPARRYKEERTLARGLRRGPGRSRGQFLAERKRLRTHFERFNEDVSQLCQWAMGLRPGGKNALRRTSEDFWAAFLEPDRFAATLGGPHPGAFSADALRLAMFKVAVGWGTIDSLTRFEMPTPVLASLERVAYIRKTPTAVRLSERLRALDERHLLVLLKAAAEWIVSRYQRACDNWIRQHDEWEKEKLAWEERHPELTLEIRSRFNKVFHELKIDRKRPRLCAWDRLKSGKDDCGYAGERIGKERHAPLCKRYKEFLSAAESKGGRAGNVKKFFPDNALKYLHHLAKRPDDAQAAREKMYAECPQAERNFPDNWERYLATLGINESTVLEGYRRHRGLPHCTKFGDEACAFNPHTDLCVQYRERLKRLPSVYLALEGTYREWRADYLFGPRKPSFRYPSSRSLPMPKIFGRDFFEVDFARSVVRLRLDDMAEGEFLEFAFKAWPRDYRPQPGETEISSVHVHFVGVRARIGFRFAVVHAASRFGVAQEEIDELRSRTFPRRAQDNEFLAAARARLLESFAGEPKREPRLLAVDLGERGAGAALFEGSSFMRAELLKVVKREKLFDRPPKPAPAGKTGADADTTGLGLGKEHVGRHLEALAEGAKAIAERRSAPADVATTLRRHDLRHLVLHTGWMLRDWVRLNARRIVELAERERVDLIVFESLRGFAPPGYDKIGEEAATKKRRLAFFAYGRIRRKVAEKAVERGMRVVTVPYFGSSQVCSQCGATQANTGLLKKNKAKCDFTCERCRQSLDSDLNAARVLARVFWGEIVLPSEQREQERRGKRN